VLVLQESNCFVFDIAILNCAIGADISSEKEFYIESYGVRVRIGSNDERLLEDARRTAEVALAGQMRFLAKGVAGNPPVSFTLTRDSNNDLIFGHNGDELFWGGEHRDLLKFFNSNLRVSVGEQTTSHAFIHAGVVARNGKALLLPASSNKGKTTLVGELIRSGAEYYSDEYAVLGEDGQVQPFPRLLSYRKYEGDRVGEELLSPASFGAEAGTRPVPVGMVLFTEYKEDACWNPEILSPGTGMMQCFPFSVSLRSNPEFSLGVIRKALSRAVIVKSPRGEAADFAKIILSYFDEAVS